MTETLSGINIKIFTNRFLVRWFSDTAQYDNLKQMVKTKSEKFDVQSMINKALIGILISKKIITEEEMVNHIRKK